MHALPKMNACCRNASVLRRKPSRPSGGDRANHCKSVAFCEHDVSLLHHSDKQCRYNMLRVISQAAPALSVSNSQHPRYPGGRSA